MLLFPLKKEWYDKIKSGEKTIEYREVKPYWTKRLQKELGNTPFEPVHYISDKTSDLLHLQCILQLGYTKQRLKAYINKIEVVNGINTDLHIDRTVYAVHLYNVKEVV